MTYIWSVIIILSILFSIMIGNVDVINNVILKTSYETLQSYTFVASNIILWSGILEVAISSGVMKYFTFFIKPIIRKLFKTKNEETLDCISANIACNILSLGSASTPFGLKAMENLKEESADKNRETRDMATLIIINVCGFSLMPTSLMSLRVNYNSIDNSVVLFYIILVSLITTVVMLIINSVVKKCI